jgi:hypothetical protein
MATLVVLGLAGIIVDAAVDKDQTTFVSRTGLPPSLR